MELHIPSKRNGRKRWYCGPFAIAAITGCSFEQAREWANLAKGRENLNTGICSMTDGQVRDALGMAGYTAVISHWNRGEKKLTFKEFLKLPRGPDDVHLVSLTDHFVTVQGNYFIDNHTGHRVLVDYAPWQRKRVRIAWGVIKGDPFAALKEAYNPG